MPRSNKALISFTAGEWSPAKDARMDLAKAPAALRTCKNMIIDRYGGVFRRPGLRFISEVKNFAAISYVSYEGSGVLYGITEFGDLSDPPRKFRNLISNDSYLSLWAPSTSFELWKIGVYGRVNYNDAGSKTSQTAYYRHTGNAGSDMALPGSPPAGAPEWMGFSNSGSSIGGAVIDSLENYVSGSANPPAWDLSYMFGTWVRNKQKKGFIYSTIADPTGADANSPGWFWQSRDIGNPSSSNSRAPILVYAVCGSSVWTVYTFYSFTSPPTGTGVANSLYVKLASGDNPVDASSGGVLIASHPGAFGGPSYVWSVFTVPKDTSIRFYMTVDGGYSGQFPHDHSADSFPITDDEIVAAGGRNWFYLPDVSPGVEGDNEYAELLTVEDKPIDFLASSGASGVTVGTEEWAQTSAYTGGITAESHSPINYTKRVVRSTYTLTGLTVGYTYPVTLTYSQRDIGGANPTTVQEVVNVLAATATQIETVDVTAPVGKERKLINASQGTGVAPVSITTRYSETLLWEARVLGNGGTYQTADLDACDYLIAQLIAQGLRTKNFYLPPFLGTNIDAAMCPLIDSKLFGIMDKDAYSTPFVDADFSRTTGLQGGAGKLIALPFSPNLIDLNSGKMGIGADVLEADNSGDAGSRISNYISDSNAYFFGLNGGDNGSYSFNYGFTGSAHSVASSGGSSSTAFHVACAARSLTDRELYLDGVSLATNTASATWSQANDQQMPLMGDFQMGSPGAWHGRLGLAYYNAGTMSDADHAAMQTVIENFNTYLGRS